MTAPKPYSAEELAAIRKGYARIQSTPAPESVERRFLATIDARDELLRRTAENHVLYRCRCGEYGRVGWTCPECGWDRTATKEIQP